jgi:predicted ATPase
MYLESIPEQLLNIEHFQEDVSILIGENGSGKSTLLNKLSKHFLRHNKNVIALANSIHDKFDRGNPNFKILSGRSGRRQTRSTIKDALINIGDNDIQRLKNASQTLRYVGFDPRIGFRIDKLKPQYNELVANSELTEHEKEEIIYLLDKTIREFRRDEIIWLEVDSFNFNEIEKSSLTSLFKWESKLRSLKVISHIEVFLQKKEQRISVLEASSGELTLIISIIYLSTLINEKTIILIDEPENSLHPKWQKEYSKILMDIFYLFQPKIIIATHSPLVVNGSELFITDPKVYKSENFSFQLQNKEPLNVEELLFRFFDITTPQNRFLSDRIVRLLNLLANDKISFENFKNEISKIQENSYDPKQLEVLKEIVNIAVDLTNNNKE